MKKYQFIKAGLLLIILAPMMMLSCKKQEKELTQKEKIMAANAGLISVDINGKHWNDIAVLATYDRPYNGRWSLGIETFIGDLSGGGLSIGNIDNSLPHKKVYSAKSRGWMMDKVSSTASFMNAEDDMGYNLYDVIEDSLDNNWVKIERYDSVSNKARGSFQVNVYKVSGQTLPGYSDTMKFTGTFDVKIKE